MPFHVIDRQPETGVETTFVLVAHLEKVNVGQLADQGGGQMRNLRVDDFHLHGVADFPGFFIGKVRFSNKGADDPFTVPTDPFAGGGPNRSLPQRLARAQDVSQLLRLSPQHATPSPFVSISDESPAGSVVPVFHQDSLDRILNLFNMKKVGGFLVAFGQVEDHVLGKRFGSATVLAADRSGGLKDDFRDLADIEVDKGPVPFLQTPKQWTRVGREKNASPGIRRLNGILRLSLRQHDID